MADALMSKVYLGDSVYVDTDGFYITLTTDNEEGSSNPSNIIHLEPPVYCKLLQYVEKLVGAPFNEISLMGGGSTSDVWCQIYADVLNRKVKQAKHGQESNSIGAALIASVALGKIKWDDIPSLISYKAVYTPQKQNRKIYDALFKEFVNIYKNNHKMYRRLNKFH